MAGKSFSLSLKFSKIISQACGASQQCYAINAYHQLIGLRRSLMQLVWIPQNRWVHTYHRPFEKTKTYLKKGD